MSLEAVSEILAWPVDAKAFRAILLENPRQVLVEHVLTKAKQRAFAEGDIRAHLLQARNG
jgi:hypothetical protein